MQIFEKKKAYVYISLQIVIFLHISASQNNECLYLVFFFSKYREAYTLLWLSFDKNLQNAKKL